MKPRAYRLAIFLVFALGAASPTLQAQSLTAGYSGSYSLSIVGTIPVPPNNGGITFLDNNTLLIGGGANSISGAIYQISVTRDGSNHVNGFSGSATLYKNAAQIDGGLAFGPGGVLFATTYSNNTILQYKPGGGLNPDKIISLTPLGVLGSTGTLSFVPASYGLPNVGALRIASYSAGGFYSAILAADGTGTYNITSATLQSQLNNGPEGIVYIPPGSPVFGVVNRYMLISEYLTGQVSAYQLDANGFPIPGTRDTFITGLGGAEGAVLDPLTNDFLFSSFGSTGGLFEVRGFAAIPEPSTITFMGLVVLGAGVMGLHSWMRKKKERDSDC